MAAGKGSIRPVRLSDAPALAEIYRPYVEDTAISFEYEAPDAAEFEGRIAKITALYPYLVYEAADGQLLGYAYASAYKGRRAYDWAVETSIYVRQDARGRHIGQALYLALEGELRRQHVINANACIAAPRPGNTRLDDSSLRFHARMGYEKVGVFHRVGFKFDQWYDMCWMEKMLGPHPEPAEPFIPYGELTPMEAKEVGEDNL